LGSAVGGLLGGGAKSQKASPAEVASGKYYEELVRLSKLSEEKTVPEILQIYAALKNGTDNPLFQKYMQEEKDNYINQNRNALMDMILVSNRAKARGIGSGGLINPERRDEMQARTIGAAYDTADATAKAAARTRLTDLAGMNNNVSATILGNAAPIQSAASGLGQIGQIQSQRAAANQQQKASTFAGLGNIAGGLFERSDTGKSLIDSIFGANDTVVT